MSENEASQPNCEANSQVARRKRMEISRVKYISDSENGIKQARLSISHASFSRECTEDDGGDVGKSAPILSTILRPLGSTVFMEVEKLPKYGVASVCGRRRDMEDAVAIHPSFLTKDDNQNQTSSLHYFGVYDGHGCSHVRVNIFI